ncbi:MAG: DUF4342 domain-containing protein [Chloroflexi bacterium]|nr:MAG: DUF4342 domain-containing protein [Chloroflexota bacterium]
MGDEEKIHVENEGVNGNGRSEWTEEIRVTGEELVATIRKLVHETNVRRIVVKNEKRHIHLEIPLLLGVAGVALLPAYAALGLIAALVTDCTIEVVRVAENGEPQA